MWTCNRLDLQTLGSQPVIYAQKSPRSLQLMRQGGREREISCWMRVKGEPHELLHWYGICAAGHLTEGHCMPTQAKSRDHEIVRAHKKVSVPNHVVVYSHRPSSVVVKAYVTGASTKCYFNERLFMRVFTIVLYNWNMRWVHGILQYNIVLYNSQSPPRLKMLPRPSPPRRRDPRQQTRNQSTRLPKSNRLRKPWVGQESHRLPQSMGELVYCTIII